MKPLLSVLFLLISFELPAQLVCFTKQCTNGGNVSKSLKDSFKLKPASPNYEIESFTLGFNYKGEYIEQQILGKGLPVIFTSAFAQKGNIPVYFTNIRLRDKRTGKLAKTEFKIVLVD
jgi:hypothetical protein